MLNRFTTLLTILLTVSLSTTAFAQNIGDTIVVQTLDFNDITKRRGWYIFPSDTMQYEKILMYYTLKCDPQTTQDNFDCGEWDYTTFTNTYLHNNTGTPYYTIGGSAPDTVEYVSNPTYTYYQSYQYNMVYDNVISENDYAVGSGSTPMDHTFQTSNATGKAQYLFRASELTSAGMSAGNVDKLRMDLSALGTDLNYLQIRMKHTAYSDIDINNYETSGFTNVYEYNTTFGSLGLNDLNFTTPFNWDGTSNIVVEFCYNNNGPGTDNTVVGDATGFNSAVYSQQDDGYLAFRRPDYVDVPASAFAAIDSFITVSFWCYGDPNAMPSNSYAFEGRDANGYRVINSHLPWSNSRVYWDAGNSGTSGYDRIDQAANFADFAGQWNHWAFTKDVSTGEMFIYLNGVLWHSGTGKTRTMDGITSFKIAGQASSTNGRYDGYINDFRVFNATLDATTIQNWMFKDVDPSHPYYSNLAAYYKFDDMNGLLAGEEVSNQEGTLIGTPAWEYIDGCDHFRNMTQAMERPNIVFVQGNYNTHWDSTLVTDSVMNPPITIFESLPTIDINSTGITMTAVDTVYAWLPGYSYTYDNMGNVLDSIWVGYSNQLFNFYSSSTFQIQNYVTPYGIGLDLGPDGTRWVYDVTDYAPVLHDTIDFSAGNQQELIDVKFMMIVGTPPRDVISAETIWTGDWGHAAIADDVVLPAVDIDLDPNASMYRIKTRTTGHGFGSGENCAEFCPKLHHLEINGVQQFQWLNWKECADNPVFPQGGTWIYDRAGWCPGTFGDTYDHELTPLVTPGTTVSVDYGMEAYPGGGGEGNYRIAVQLISYGAPNFALDAAITDIVSPNDWEIYGRMNPICASPRVKIKNTGSTTLTSLDITYMVDGGTAETYTWNGSLDFLEEEEVSLPISGQTFWVNGGGGAQNTFIVTISSPNGGADEYAYNNTYTTTYEVPPVYYDGIVVWALPNSAAAENSWNLYDDQNNVIASRSAGTYTAYAQHKDTVLLNPGCYRLEFLDSDDDGMSFFANNDGNGWVRLRDMQGAFVSFNPNFGRSIIHSFTIGYTLEEEEYENATQLNIYPNPSKGEFNLVMDGYADQTVNIQVVNLLGEVMYSKDVSGLNNKDMREINLSHLADGIYYVRVSSGEYSNIKQIVKQ